MTVVSFTTDRPDGDARAPGALRRILKKRGISAASAHAEQVHGSKIASVPRLKHPRKFAGVDGFLTDATDQPLAIFTADCVPIFLTAGKPVRVVGLLHAGWRGVQKKILARALQLLRQKWRLRASQVSVWAGPRIGPCCFEVQWDVAQHFPLTRKRSGDRWTVDLAQELERQARSLGVRWQRKKPLEGCTMHGKRYFSFRRDKTEKRQVSVIVKK